jgi:hypothetical protein
MFHKHISCEGENKYLACYCCINYVSRPKRVLSPSCLFFISIISNGSRFVTADLHLVSLDPLPLNLFVRGKPWKLSF